MKVGFYCESPADQAALAVFTEGILGQAPDPINMDLEAHSVPAFFRSLDGVFRGVHYNSDAEGLVVVVDCDRTQLHDPTHDADDTDVGDCRLCEVRRILAKARKQIRPRPNRPELKVAVGLTVPSIEAWYLVGKNRQVGEAAWRAGAGSNQPPFTKAQLKRLVYGTDRPSFELATQRAVEEARRIILDLNAIESAFPAGFGTMAKEIRSWISH